MEDNIVTEENNSNCPEIDSSLLNRDEGACCDINEQCGTSKCSETEKVCVSETPLEEQPEDEIPVDLDEVEEEEEIIETEDTTTTEDDLIIDEANLDNYILKEDHQKEIDQIKADFEKEKLIYLIIAAGVVAFFVLILLILMIKLYVLRRKMMNAVQIHEAEARNLFNTKFNSQKNIKTYSGQTASDYKHNLR